MSKFLNRRQIVTITRNYVAIITICLFLVGCYPDSAENEALPNPIRQTTTETLSVRHKFGEQNIENLLNPAPLEQFSPGAKYSANKSYGNLPLMFEANRGQLDSRVKFTSRGKGYNFFITPTETVLVLNKQGSGDESKNSKNEETLSRKPKKTTIQKSVVRMQFVGIDKKNKISGVDELPGKSSYFIGGDSSKWQSNVSQYAKVKQESIYPGVDVLYYGNQNQLEYDLMINAGADPSKIKLKLEGAQKKYIDAEGNLVLQTEAGEIKQSKPIAYQQIDGQKINIDCRYALLDKNQVGFEVGAYDASEPLTIDPVIDYSTFIGGTNIDFINDIAVDASGNVYVTGYTTSTNFPTTSGAFRTTNSGTTDAFILKLNPTGTGLVYSTYVGGGAADYGNSIAIDSSGNAYISGQTSSTNLPTLNARQANYGGNPSDGFVLKLNATGNALLFSTYHGGSGEDSSSGVAIDASGNAYLSGTTISTNFPMLNAYQSAIGTYTCQGCSPTPTRDAFVSKLSSTGTLVYSTFLGTNVWDDFGNNIAVDSAGSAYIIGDTNAQNFPTISAFQPNKAGDYQNRDTFITKFNAAGNALVYSSYLGGYNPFWCDPFFCVNGRADDIGKDVAVDASGSAYLVGTAESVNFPTVNAYQSFNNGSTYDVPFRDVYVTKVSPSGTSLVYSTYLGGSGHENAYAIKVDSSGSAYVAGSTESTNFPLVNPLQTAKSGGATDAFVAKFNPGGNTVSYSTYLGSEGYEQIFGGIGVDSQGNAYVAGSTQSTNFSTGGSFQPVSQGNWEGFITKITNANGFTISGKVSKPDGSGAANVTIKLSGGLNTTVYTDAGGNFSFVNLAPNRQYTVTPLSGTFTFVPQSQTFSNLSNNAIADFVIETYNISGQVTNAAGGVANVTVALSGGQTGTILTDSNGFYLFSNLPGGSYTVTPSKTDPILTYSFTPPSQSMNNITSSQIVNFTANTAITTELNAIADAYVQDGTVTGTNFGTATTLKAETDSKINNNKNFDSYLKFDLASVNLNIQSAKLRIYAASSTTGGVATSAYSVSAVNWIESGTGGITWSNKPARSATALTGASATVTGTTFATYDIDVTNYIKTEKAAGRNIVSLALHNPTSSTLFITANSREAASDKPRLVIKTSGDYNVTPLVAMTAPANGATFTAPAAVTVSASAADTDGTISRVDFYDGTTLIGSSTTPVSGNTYSVNWNNVPAGSYVLSAIAFDDRGAQATAAPVNITVNPANNLPSVSLVAPTANSTFAVGSNINLSAAADDADGSISKVEFFAGATLIGTATTPASGNNYTVTWNNAPTGSHALTAKATDNSNGVTTSTAVNISVVGQIGLSPTADAYVQDGASATTNFGTSAELRTQVSATSGSNRETYLKFDLTTATGINKAVLRLYGRLSDATGTNVPISVYPVATTTWVESGSGSVTWNTKPVAGATVLAATTVTDNTARWYELDLTSYVQNEKAAGRNVVSFAVKGNAASSPYALFNSKESTTNQPQLIMRTTQPRDVLMVVGSATLNTGDAAVRTRLLNLGFTVTVKVAGSTTNTSIKAADADGKALVLVSSTVTPANVAAKLKNIPVPVLNWEFDLADDFGMTGAVSGTDFGSAASQTQSVIITPAHPMSAGLTGTVSLVSAASAFSWGKPNANADKIASLTSDSTRLVIYGYDNGKTMFGLDAPARRVAVYLSDTTAASLTTNGGLLFDAAVKWASQVSTAPVISALSPNLGNIGTAVTVTGTNFGASQGSGTVTFNGIAATVTNWSNTSINTVVPSGAATGFVVVTVGGVSSNGATFTVTASNGDSDGDGLPDAWEMQYFGNLSNGANNDPDGDGITNLQEYLQGRNPTRGNIFVPNSVDLKVFTQLEP